MEINKLWLISVQRKHMQEAPCIFGSLFPYAFHSLFLKFIENSPELFGDEPELCQLYSEKWSADLTEIENGGATCRSARNIIRYNIVVMLAPLSCCINQPWPASISRRQARQGRIGRVTIPTTTIVRDTRSRNGETAVPLDEKIYSNHRKEKDNIPITALGIETPIKTPRPNVSVRR